MVKVLIYSTETCPYCQKAKEFFKEHNIEYEEVNVAEDEKAREEMVKKSGQMGVPVIEIKRAHSVGIIIGFDETKLKQALGIE